MPVAPRSEHGARTRILDLAYHRRVLQSGRHLVAILRVRIADSKKGRPEPAL